MSTIEILSQKEKGLIAIASSIASGCQPCTVHHIKAARDAGAAEAEIGVAIENALWVRISATKIMTGVAQGSPSNEYTIETQIGSLNPTINELVLIGASLACNFVNGLEYHLQKAQVAGASDYHVLIAMGIARDIRKEAEKKMEAAVERVLKPTKGKDDDSCGNDCGCQKSNSSQIRDTTESIADTPGKETIPQSCDCG